MIFSLNAFVMVTFVVAVLLSSASCGFTSRNGANQLRTPDKGLSQQRALEDDQWQFERVASVPAEKTYHGITCTSDGPCWIWDSRSIWLIENGALRQMFNLDSEKSELLTGAFLSSRQVGWLTRSSGLYRTDNGGSTWTRINVPDLDDRKGSLEDVYFRDEKIGWIVGGKYRELRKGEGIVNNAMSDDRKGILTGSVLRTSDGGISWDVRETGRFVGRFARLAFLNSWGIAFGDAGCVVTQNDGKQWTEILRRFRDKNTGEVPVAQDAFLLDNRYGWITLSGGLIIATSNGGKSWRLVYGATESGPSKGPDTLRRISFVDATHGLGISDERGGGRLFKTVDAGKTWTEIPSEERFSSLTFPQKENGFLLGRRNLYRVSRSSNK